LIEPNTIPVDNNARAKEIPATEARERPNTSAEYLYYTGSKAREAYSASEPGFAFTSGLKDNEPNTNSKALQNNNGKDWLDAMESEIVIIEAQRMLWSNQSSNKVLQAG